MYLSIYLSVHLLSVCLFISGILKLAAVIFAFLLAVFLAFQLLEINMDFKLGSVMCKWASLIMQAEESARAGSGRESYKKKKNILASYLTM